MKPLALLCLALAAPALANDKHEPPKAPIVIVEHQHDGAAYALVGAAVTWWLLHRHEKRHPHPVAATCPDVKEVERRVERACSK